MKNIIKKISAAAMAMTLLGTGTIVRDNSIFYEKNGQALTADAASSSASYIKYRDINEYIDKKIRGNASRITYYYPTYHFIEWRVGDADRQHYDIPNENNCTIICVLNLLVYKLKRNGYSMNDSLYRYYYNELVKMATNEFSYTWNGGLPLANHKNFCKAALKRYSHGYDYSEPDVKTFSLPQELVSVSNTPNKPFILSSSAENHSVIVKEKVTWHVEYLTKKGKKVYKDIDFFGCFDPNGDRYLVEAGKVVDLLGIDFEQVMYVDN